MKKSENEIRQANRKAMPAFILMVVISALVGGVIGYCAMRYGLGHIAEGLAAAGAFFAGKVAPWLMVAGAVVLPILCLPRYTGAKRRMAGWDGEDEAASDRIEKEVSLVIWVSNTFLIVSFFLVTAVYSRGFALLDEPGGEMAFWGTILAFLAIMVESTMLQQKCVDMVKRMNPEKKGSVYDLKFQKEWLESCDEAERLQIGEASRKAYAATNGVCVVLAVVLALSGLIFRTGLLAALVVCVVWLVNQTVYFMGCMAQNGGRNR